MEKRKMTLETKVMIFGFGFSGVLTAILIYILWFSPLAPY